MDEYEQQAQDFLESTGTKLTLTRLGTFPHFTGEIEERDVYQVTLSNSKGAYSFQFGDSLYNTQRHLFAKDYSNMLPLSKLDERKVKRLGFNITDSNRLFTKEILAAKNTNHQPMIS